MQRENADKTCNKAARNKYDRIPAPNSTKMCGTKPIEHKIDTKPLTSLIFGGMRERKANRVAKLFLKIFAQQ